MMQLDVQQVHDVHGLCLKNKTISSNSGIVSCNLFMVLIGALPLIFINGSKLVSSGQVCLAKAVNWIGGCVGCCSCLLGYTIFILRMFSMVSFVDAVLGT